MLYDVFVLHLSIFYGDSLVSDFGDTHKKKVTDLCLHSSHDRFIELQLLYMNCKPRIIALIIRQL